VEEVGALGGGMVEGGEEGKEERIEEKRLGK
jgi:hypothetical protein